MKGSNLEQILKLAEGISGGQDTVFLFRPIVTKDWRTLCNAFDTRQVARVMVNDTFLQTQDSVALLSDQLRDRPGLTTCTTLHWNVLTPTWTCCTAFATLIQHAPHVQHVVLQGGLLDHACVHPIAEALHGRNVQSVYIGLSNGYAAQTLLNKGLSDTNGLWPGCLRVRVDRLETVRACLEWVQTNRVLDKLCMDFCRIYDQYAMSLATWFPNAFVGHPSLRSVKLTHLKCATSVLSALGHTPNLSKLCIHGVCHEIASEYTAHALCALIPRLVKLDMQWLHFNSVDHRRVLDHVCYHGVRMKSLHIWIRNNDEMVLLGNTLYHNGVLRELVCMVSDTVTRWSSVIRVLGYNKTLCTLKLRNMTTQCVADIVTTVEQSNARLTTLELYTANKAILERVAKVCERNKRALALWRTTMVCTMLCVAACQWPMGARRALQYCLESTRGTMQWVRAKTPSPWPRRPLTRSRSRRK